jgi:hypothetical protein
VAYFSPGFQACSMSTTDVLCCFWRFREYEQKSVKPE